MLLSLLASLALWIAASHGGRLSQAPTKPLPSQPADAIARDADIIEMPSHDFRFPLLVEDRYRSRIKEIRLVVSEDLGKTWQKVAVATPDQNHIDCSVMRDGLYFFSLQIVDQLDQLTPATPEHLTPRRKVLVSTQDD